MDTHATPQPVDAEAPAARLKHGAAGLAVLIGGLLLYFLVSTFLQMGFMGRLLDDGQYFVAARSLAYAGEYRLPSRPTAVTATKYPPGLSLLLSVPLRWVGRPDDWRHDESICRLILRFTGVAFGVALYVFYLKVGLQPVAAALAGLAVLFQPGVLVLNGRVLSDVPFAALVCWLLIRWVGIAPQNRGVRSAVIDGVIAGAALLMRTSALALVPATLAACAMGRRKALSMLTVCALMAGSWWLSAATRAGPPRPPPGSGDYVAEFAAGYREPGAWYANPLERVAEMLSVSGELLIPNASERILPRAQKWMYKPFGWTIGLVGLALMVVGFRRHLPLMDARYIAPVLFAAGTLGLYAVWPVPFDYRFALPLSPLAMLWLSGGVAAVAVALLRRREWVPAIMQLVWVFLGLKGLVLVGVTVASRSYVQGGWVTLADRRYLHALTVLQRQTPADAVIGGMAPEAIFLYTGRQSFPIIEDDDMNRRYGDASRMQVWIDRCENRPIYLFALDPNLPAIEARQLKELLGRDLPYRAEDIFMEHPYRLVRLHRR